MLILYKWNVYKRGCALINQIAHNSLLPFYRSNQLGQAGGNYNLCFSYSLHDKKTADLLIEKVIELVKLKAYLRQNFSIKSKKLLTNIHHDLLPEVIYYKSKIGDLDQLEDKLINEIHDLNTGSPIKISCIQVENPAHFIVLLNIHHIVMDGITLDRFLEDLNRLLANRVVDHESIEAYASMLSAEQPLKKQVPEPLIDAYLNKIEHVATEIEFYTDLDEHEALHYKQVLPKNTFDLLQAFCHQHQFSPFNILLVVYEIFLAKILNQKQMLVSYPINIRSNKAINGCFLNVVDLPLSLTKKSSFLSVLHELKALFPTLKLAAKHMLEKPKHGRTPIFSSLTVADLPVLMIAGNTYTAKSYPQITYANVSLKYREQHGQLFFVCDVIKGLFPTYFTETILTRFFSFLEKILHLPNVLLIELDLLSEEEKQTLLVDFNQTTVNYPENKTINQLFEAQVKKTPTDIALVVDGQKISYLALNQRANQLARYIENAFFNLTQRNIQPDDLIPIFVERNLDMLITMLAILKTGAAYVPIDSSFKKQRIQYILDDIQSPILLTQHRLEKKLKTLTKLPCLFVDDNAYHLESNQDVIVNNKPHHLAYVIYTSGTTGMPKGVMVEHFSVINTLHVMYGLYEIQKHKKVTAYTSYVFDVSVVEIFTVLTQGGELHLLTQQRKDVQKLAKYLNQEKIEVVYLPPAILALLPKIDFPALKIIMFAGETCDPATGQYWLKKHILYNCYGPTEVTIYATYKQVESRNINEIGKPLHNVTAYVLDVDNHPVSIGLIGELYLGGKGVARGYLNKQKLTNERFIANPFQTPDEKQMNNNGRLYKTGDLVRWLPDGNLEYIGRNDFQVKIMGHRIELREIEAAIQKIDDIEQSLVTVVNGAEHHKFLCAYYVAKQAISTQAILESIEKHLPHHMIPSTFIEIKKFPINSSGKIDRKLLPKPDLNTLLTEYVAPRNLAEERVCHAFSKALRLKKVGIFDDFFRVGGNSLNAIHLTSLLQHEFNINMSDVFKLRTPADIAKKIPFAQRNFREQLEKNAVICLKQEQQVQLCHLHEEKFERYKKSIQNAPKNYGLKNLKTVLLTGGTGFLGCNLLKEILESTHYVTIVLVRASNDTEAFSRLDQKFIFYFNQSLNEGDFQSRICVLAADIEKKQFGLTTANYQALAKKVDTIIHAAGFVKHYGNHNQFYSANVLATNNMLKFAELTSTKDFHYISTISILTSEAILTEDDHGLLLENHFNSYIQTKIEGENAAIRARDRGICSSIYRIGNLAFILDNHHMQENKEDNAFYTRMKYFLQLKIIPDHYTEEITPVDLTAKAIIKLFDKQELNNQIFHIFNPHLFNIASFFLRNTNYEVASVSLNNFIENIISLLHHESNQTYIEQFLLHLGLFDDVKKHTHVSKILQNRTEIILEALCFQWQPITDHHFLNYLKKWCSD